MASGVYGKVDLSSAVANRTAAAIQVSIALRDGAGNVTDADHIESGVSLPANGVLERTGIVLDTSNGLHAYASAVGCTAVAYGMDG